MLLVYTHYLYGTVWYFIYKHVCVRMCACMHSIACDLLPVVHIEFNGASRTSLFRLLHCVVCLRLVMPLLAHNHGP